jgi:hypothetical protein
MADWRKMERHIRYSRIANAVLIITVIAQADEIYDAIKYHFPLWDDIAIPVTCVIQQAAWFVRKYTEMYRIDL